MAGGQAGGRGDLGGRGFADACAGVDGDAGDGLGPGGGDFLDVHAAFGGGDGEEVAGGAVEDVGDVVLGVDGGGPGEHDLAHLCGP